MRIRVRVLLPYVTEFGSHEVNLEVGENTLKDLINHLIATSKELEPQLVDPTGGKVRSHIRVVINGRTLEREGLLSTRLNDEDVVSFVAPVAGG